MDTLDCRKDLSLCSATGFGVGTIQSRHEITVEEFELFDQATTSRRTSELFMRLRFWDGSLLQVEEALIAQAFAIVKVRYSYHYQRADGSVAIGTMSPGSQAYPPIGLTGPDECIVDDTLEGGQSPAQGHRSSAPGG